MTQIPMNLTGKLTFVYVYVKSPEIWKELYYSVASIKKFYSKDSKIFVVGDDPKIKGVTHIPHERVKGVNSFSKAIDSVSKLEKICESPYIPENFILMYDDIVLLQPVGNEAFIHHYSMGIEDEDKVFSTVSGKPTQKWKTLFQRDINSLRKYNYPTYNYETHLPRILNKEKVMHVIRRYRMLEIPSLFATLYYNTFWEKPDVIITEPRFKHIKYGCYGPKSKEILELNTPGKIFLNYNDSGLNKELKEFIQKKIKG